MDFQSMLRRAKEEARQARDGKHDGLPLTAVKPGKLFNLLQTMKDQGSRKSLLLVDVRPPQQYKQGHIRGASNMTSVSVASGTFHPPRGSDSSMLNDKMTVICYNEDHTKAHTPMTDEGQAQVLQLIRRSGHLVKEVGLLEGGVCAFRELYPFLCLSSDEEKDPHLSAKAYMRYPVEITPQQIYVGHLFHGCNARIFERLQIKSLIDLTPNGIMSAANDGQTSPTTAAPSTAASSHAASPTSPHTPVPPALEAPPNAPPLALPEASNEQQDPQQQQQQQGGDGSSLDDIDDDVQVQGGEGNGNGDGNGGDGGRRRTYNRADVLGPVDLDDYHHIPVHASGWTGGGLQQCVRVLQKLLKSNNNNNNSSASAAAAAASAQEPNKLPLLIFDVSGQDACVVALAAYYIAAKGWPVTTALTFLANKHGDIAPSPANWQQLNIFTEYLKQAQERRSGSTSSDMAGGADDEDRMDEGPAERGESSASAEARDEHEDEDEQDHGAVDGGFLRAFFEKSCSSFGLPDKGLTLSPLSNPVRLIGLRQRVSYLFSAPPAAEADAAGDDAAAAALQECRQGYDGIFDAIRMGGSLSAAQWRFLSSEYHRCITPSPPPSLPSPPLPVLVEVLLSALDTWQPISLQQALENPFIGQPDALLMHTISETDAGRWVAANALNALRHVSAVDETSANRRQWTVNISDGDGDESAAKLRSFRIDMCDKAVGSVVSRGMREGREGEKAAVLLNAVLLTSDASPGKATNGRLSEQETQLAWGVFRALVDLVMTIYQSHDPTVRDDRCVSLYRPALAALYCGFIQPSAPQQRRQCIFAANRTEFIEAAKQNGHLRDAISMLCEVWFERYPSDLNDLARGIVSVSEDDGLPVLVTDIVRPLAFLIGAINQPS